MQSISLLCLSSGYHVTVNVLCPFLIVSLVGLLFVIVTFPGHTRLHFDQEIPKSQSIDKCMHFEEATQTTNTPHDRNNTIKEASLVHLHQPDIATFENTLKTA